MTKEGRLTTHVLDTSLGQPAAGMMLDLARLEPAGGETLLKSVTTNTDGRCDEPLLVGPEMVPATYELTFHVAAYFLHAMPDDPPQPFLGTVPIRFTITDQAAHYHVPLLVSPFGYTTYRGS